MYDDLRKANVCESGILRTGLLRYDNHDFTELRAVRKLLTAQLCVSRKCDIKSNITSSL